jgi:hypothetical protein
MNFCNTRATRCRTIELKQDPSPFLVWMGFIGLLILLAVSTGEEWPDSLRGSKMITLLKFFASQYKVYFIFFHTSTNSRTKSFSM